MKIINVETNKTLFVAKFSDCAPVPQIGSELSFIANKMENEVIESTVVKVKHILEVDMLGNGKMITWVYVK